MSLQIRSPGEQVKTTRFAHSSGTTAKTPVVINSRVWIPLYTKDANVENEYVYDAEVSGGAKATGEAWAPGNLIYWSAANSNFTTTSSGNTLVGRALESAIAGATVCPRFHFTIFGA